MVDKTRSLTDLYFLIEAVDWESKHDGGRESSRLMKTQDPVLDPV